MEDNAARRITRTLIAVCFCCFVLVMTMMNVKLAGRPAVSFLMRELTFKEMTQEIADNYVSAKLWMRSEFINFNGLFARLSGRRAYNKTMLLKNGMLNYGYETFSEAPDESLESNLADAVKELSDFLDPMGIPLYYVLAPVKEDTAGELVPEGFHNFQNQTGDHMLQLFSGHGVTTLDLRPRLTESAEQSARYFYRTDHHWNGDGALRGFEVLMDFLREEYDPQLDTSLADPAMWERFTLEHAFLGTHGKRVGALYAGTDDLIWYEPKFDTQMSLSIPDLTQFYKGPFADVNIRSEYRQRQDYFAVTPYVIYIGGDYPSVQHRNPDAPNQRKVLLLKDSFGLAVEAFLSCEFSAVDVIDPRYYTEAGIAEYCEWTRPDLVIMMMSPSAISNRYYTRVGISAEERQQIEHRQEQPLWSSAEYRAEGENLPEQLSALPVPMEAGKTYRVSFSVPDPSTAAADAVSAVLYNKTAGAPNQQWIFDTDYYSRSEDWTWTFKVPDNTEEEFQLYVCSGLFETQQNARTVLNGLTVSELR